MKALYNEVQKVNGVKTSVKVYHDEDSEPSDRLGTFHGRYNRYFTPDTVGMFDSSDPAFIVLPVYAYVHGDVRFSEEPFQGFNASFDSGLAGFIYVTLAEVRKLYGVSRVSAKLRKLVIAQLQADIATLTYEANGEVYVIKTKRSDWTKNCRTEYLSGLVGPEDVRAAINEFYGEVYGKDAPSTDLV